MEPYYDHAGITIYHADCREVLPLPSSYVVVTDPPYGVNFRNEQWDAEVPELATRLPDMFEAAAIFCGPTKCWDYPRPKWVACWARPASSARSTMGGFNHWTPVLLYGSVKMRVDFKSWHAIAYASPDYGHPCPKPVCVVKWIIGEISKPESMILDCYMGSGTTLRAAKDLGRKAIGIEIEEKYCEIAAQRMAQEVLPL